MDDVVDVEWKFWEQWHISYFKYIGCNLTNETPGGDGWEVGQKHNLESLEKMSKSQTGRKHSTETLEKMAKSQKEEYFQKNIKTNSQLLPEIVKIQEKQMNKIGSNIGTHVIVDLIGIKNSFKFDSIEVMRKIFYQAAQKAKMNVISDNWKKFEPYGLSGVLFLAESHLSIHFSPEHSFAWIDSFSCGNEGSAKIAVNHILKKINHNSEKTNILYLDRTIKG